MPEKITETVPTVSRVAGSTIVELLYDGETHKTALAVAREGKISIVPEFRLTSGETLVPYKAGNNLIRNECVMLPSQPCPSGGKRELLKDIVSYLDRYVDFSSGFSQVAAHYVLLSWVHDAFNELPYLRLKGDFGTGKTRALIALGSVSYKGFFASGASTVSPIFHTLDSFGGTLVLDEADLRFSDKSADVVKILNNGTVKGMPVLRSVQNRLKEFNPAAFRVYGPKIVAMRGSFRDQALESRFLTEEMGGRSLRSDIPIQLPNSLKEEALVLHNRLLHFRLTNLFVTASDPRCAVAGIEPRLNQTALSLLSLMDDEGSREELRGRLLRRHAEIAARRRTPESRALAAVTEVMRDTGRTQVRLSEVAARINTGKGVVIDDVTVRETARILRSHDFSLHKSNGNIVVRAPRVGETAAANAGSAR
jgi:hypothetical protein